MIKVKNGVATREPLPSFLRGLKPESLVDLSWTDPQLGVQGCAWWPERDDTPALGPDQVYDGTEVLTVDAERQDVVVVRGIRDMTPEEIHQRWLAENPVPAEVPRWAGLLALKRHVLEGDELVLLAANDARPDDNLLALVTTYRASLQPGELADRLDAALNDAKDWRIESPTVGYVAQILPLSTEHLAELFRWAGNQVETL